VRKAAACRPTKAAILQGKEQIERLLKQGYSIDDAAARIQFKSHNIRATSASRQRDHRRLRWAHHPNAYSYPKATCWHVA
jgi:hypothetical protein